ncbi:MAG TPA: hypothetical protein DEH27_06390 [Deltaproteobacteria bacterium]|nr:hypothetical protein [Deltaproteobacteria bacterium]
MHDYLEKVVAVLGEMLGKVRSLNDIGLAFFLGIIMGGSLWYIASYIVYLRRERRKKKLLQLTRIGRELFGIQETDETGGQEGKPEIDAFRRRFPFDDLPKKRTIVEDQTYTTYGEAERKHDEGKTA